MTNGEQVFQATLLSTLKGILQQLKVANGLQKVKMCYEHGARIGLPMNVNEFNNAIDEVYEDAVR